MSDVTRIYDVPKILVPQNMVFRRNKRNCPLLSIVLAAGEVSNTVGSIHMLKLLFAKVRVAQSQPGQKPVAGLRP